MNGSVTPGAQNWLVLLVILEIVIEPEVVLTRVVDNVFVWPTSTNPNNNVSGLQASFVEVAAWVVCAQPAPNIKRAKTVREGGENLLMQTRESFMSAILKIHGGHGQVSEGHHETQRFANPCRQGGCDAALSQGRRCLSRNRFCHAPTTSRHLHPIANAT